MYERILVLNPNNTVVENANRVSEVSPTLVSSIYISRDIYVGRSVGVSVVSKMPRRIKWLTRMLKVILGLLTCDSRVIHLLSARASLARTKKKRTKKLTFT